MTQRAIVCALRVPRPSTVIHTIPLVVTVLLQLLISLPMALPQAVLKAPAAKVAASIKEGGLAEIKTERIRNILRTILEERPQECKGGEPSLEYLRSMPTEKVKEVVCCIAVMCCVAFHCVLQCCAMLVVVRGVVWCGVVWCGVVWCGVVWCGVVWCGVVWCGVVWCGVVWCAEGAVTKRQRPGCLPTGTGKRAGLCVLCARCV